MTVSGGNQAPRAGFTYTADALTVTFSDTSSDDGAIAAWSWDFGDGGGSTDQNPVYSYAVGGTYDVVLTVTDDHIEYGKKVRDELLKQDLRVVLDDRNEKLGFKIRDSQTHKIPYSLVIGQKEIESGTVAVRKYREGMLGTMTVEEFARKIKKEEESKQLLTGGQ